MTTETICALATAAGGAIGVIRVSGTQALRITDKIFHASNGQSLVDVAPNTVRHGEIVDGDGNLIDDVLVTVFRAPHSYTGEDSTEISCHASSYIITQILHALIDAGCRQAKPGEYTQRAYLNGKMDLSQAEAVADLIATTNRATHKMALSQLKGNFSNELSALRNELLKITSLIELELDFSDQDVNFADRNELQELARAMDRRITSLAHSFETGNALKKGVPVAIVGKTNVGKSTLLNRLLHEDRAIVSNIHGTTRDVIEDTVEIRGVTFRFIDTAGIRPTEDEIERLGIERTYKKINEASIILWLVDAQPTSEQIVEIRATVQGKRLIAVWNKIDVPTSQSISLPVSPLVRISAKHGAGLQLLEEELYRAADIPEIKENDIIITSARHYEALTRAHESISRVIEGLQQNRSGDLLSEDLRICIDQLAEITGCAITTSEVLQSIFQNFCIGK